jgi:tetratricopeptide (TPR) repeat protein
MSAEIAIQQLRKHLTPGHLAIIYPALRQDLLAWERIQEPGFLDRVQGLSYEQMKFWKPCNLALLDIESESTENDKEIRPLYNRGEDLNLDLSQDPKSQISAVHSLQDAGTLAFDFLKRHQGLEQLARAVSPLVFLFEASTNNDRQSIRTVFTCLFGLLEEPSEFFLILRKQTIPETVDQIFIHSLLSNPLSLDEQYRIVSTYSQGLSSVEKTALTSLVKVQNRDELSREMARSIIESDLPSGHLHQNTESVTAALQMANLYEMAGDAKKAYKILSDVSDRVSKLSTTVEMKKGNLEEHRQGRSKHEPGLDPTKDGMDKDESEGEDAAGRVDDVEAGKLANSSPEIQLHYAANIELNHGKAKQMGMEAAGKLLNKVKFESGQTLGDEAYFYFPMNILNNLEKLGLDKEACQLEPKLLDAYPNDRSLLQGLRDRRMARKDWQGAFQCAQTLVALDPLDHDNGKTLVEILEQQNRFNEAYEELQRFVKEKSHITVDELLSVASLALRIARYEDVIDVCEQVLLQESRNPMAMVLMGKACLGSNKITQAAECFQKVFASDPSNEEALVGNIQILKRSGKITDWFSALKSGLEKNPESARLNYEMGLAVSETDPGKEAMRYLKKAYMLDPGSVDTCGAYARVLIEDNEMEEADKIIGDGLKKWENDPVLNYLAGLIHVQEGKLEKAVESLEIAAVSETATVEHILRFVRTLIQKLDDDFSSEKNVLDRERIYKASELISGMPEKRVDPAVQFVAAKVTFYSGDPRKALEEYRRMAGRTDSVGHDLAVELKASIGQAALATDQVEIAIASLQEADILDSSNRKVKRWLAEAYQKADLKEDAFARAVQALEIAPEDDQALSWYAGFIHKLGKLNEALAAYDRASALFPQDRHILLEKSKLEAELGALGESEATLAQLVAMNGLPFDTCQAAAHLAFACNDPDLVLRFLEKAAEGSLGNNVLVTLQKAVVRTLKKDPNGAVQNLKQIGQQEQTEWWHPALMALIYEQAGEKELAATLFQRALGYTNYLGMDDEIRDYLPIEWQNMLAAPRKTAQHLYRLYCDTGAYQAAYELIMKLKREDPDDLRSQFEAAKLAWMLLKIGDVKQCLDFPAETYKTTAPANRDCTEKVDASTIGEILALKTHWDIEFGTEEDIRTDIEELSACGCEVQIARTAQIRAAYRNGASKHPTPAISEECFSEDPFTASTLLQMGEPGKAIHAAEIFRKNHPAYPFSGFNLARAIIIAAEQAHYDRLFAFGNAEKKDGAITEEELRKASELLEEMTTAGDEDIFKKWRSRLQLLFGDNSVEIATKPEDMTSPEEALAVALYYWRNGEFEQCMKYCLLFPNDPALSILLSLVLARINMNECIIKAGANVQSYPEVAHAFIAQAIINEQSADLTGALRSIKTALQLQPDRVDWHLKVVELAEMLGDAAEKGNALECAHTIDPRNLILAKDLVRYHLLHGKPERAVEIIEKDAALRNDGTEVGLLLARAYAALENKKASLENLENVVHSTSASPRDFIDAGYLALEISEYQKGFEYARKAALLDPTSSDAIVLMARLMKKRNGPQESIRFLESALEKGRVEYAIRKEHALLVSQIKGEETSLAALEKLISENATDPEVLAAICQAQYKKGMIVEARESAQKALKADAHQPRAHFILGEISFSEGNLDQAIHHFSECAQMEPENPDTYLQLSNVFSKRREYQQATHSLLKGIEMNPAEPKLYTAAASLFKQGKDYQQAENMLRKAASLLPQDLNVQRQLGAIVALNLVHSAQEVNITL